MTFSPALRAPALVAMTPAEAARLLEMATPRDEADAVVIAHLRHLLARAARREQNGDNT